MSVQSLRVWLGFAVLIGAAIAPSFLFWHPTYSYASGKHGKLRSVANIRRVDHSLRIAAVLVGGAALVRVDPLLLQWHHSIVGLYAGIIISLAGVALLVASKRALGWNYSPVFDGYVPFRIVDDGVYRYLRHPMYVARLTIAAGACVMTGTAWLAVAWLVALGWYWQAAMLEEADLARWFPGYRLYTKRTSAFVPRLGPSRGFSSPRTAVAADRGDAPEVLTLAAVESPGASSTSDAA